MNTNKKTSPPQANIFPLRQKLNHLETHVYRNALPFIDELHSKFSARIIITLILVALASLILSACSDQNPIPPSIVNDDEVHFLAVGRQGYKSPVVKEIARSMETLSAQRKNINFTLLLGDNFYPKGVDSIHDPQWTEKFESIYDGPYQRAIPFFAVLGNHDHQGNVAAQIQYATEQMGSARWRMDAPFYSRDFGQLNGRPLVRIVFLDSVLLDGAGMQKRSNEVTRSRAAQIDFLRSQFSSPSNAPCWKVIASHYSFRSMTSAQFTRDRVMEDLSPLLTELKVDLVLSANDCFQQIIDEPGGPLHVGTNGGGSKKESIATIDSPSILTTERRGFGAFHFYPGKMTTELYDQHGESVYVRKRCR